ncbi:WcaF family extracellular polysaccharide biosynthesis acetyltransferase [Mucilaginibacter sabulilitoris]|uniref:WcaF family extracellular polysaccharide biosynthesis acetyltransferase n=1 Tax=Mucilaginibacter sabulilitoris TaxID=1173583 RepID=A0ABZ0TRT4_9SPHI|nr:WcaF family extracellular polysaccharide biosynthesis acetyltransferase [Mucilaginibacter sabulilitoris]WPU95619.1 WcaF family extracellular polysaccharide biosynthesis acetyltransferase [Mucilaginibacter sabulilitoris]
MISKVQLKNFDSNIGFNRGATKLKLIMWYMAKMLFFNAFPFPNSIKRRILILFGARIGKGLVIKPKVNIHMPWKLEIGNDVWIGEEVFILNFEYITIGNNVCVSQRAFLCGGNHDFRNPSMPYRNGPITLEDGSWIGANVFVGPSVSIGTDTVVSAGSVVTKSLLENAIYKGNPCQYVKERWTTI